MPLPADVLFAGKLSADEAAQLAQEFEAVGLTADIREVSPRRYLDEIAWLVLAAVPLKPFFDQLAKDSATDAFSPSSARFSTDVSRRRPSRPRSSCSRTARPACRSCSNPTCPPRPITIC